MQNKSTKKTRKPLIFIPLSEASKAATTSPATVPPPTLDPLLADALKSLETPLEVLTAQYLDGAQQELEASIKALDKPITGPGDSDNSLDDLLGPIIMRGEESEVEYMMRSIAAYRWGISEQDAPLVAQHLTMLDRLTYCALTGQDPATVADPEQLEALLPVAQLAAAAITRLMSKTETTEN